MLSRLFKKTERFYSDFAFLTVDMHSHLLPSVDDGSKTVEDSIRFIEGLRRLGWRGVLTTPHILSDLYPNSPETLQPRFIEVKNRMPADFQFSYAAEYMVDEYFDSLVKIGKTLLTFGDRKVLIEMSYLAESPRIRENIFDLRVKGYKPVLAHPERYNFYHRRYDRLCELKDMGCEFQLNLLSLTGYYGTTVRESAMRLLSDQMYSYAATDLHHDKHLESLNAMTKSKSMTLLTAYNFINKDLLQINV